MNASQHPDERAAQESGSMDPVWERIDAELSRRGKTWAWLNRKIGVKSGAAGNWRGRRVPPEHYQGISDAFGESVDWLLGKSPRRAEDASHLSPMAQALALEFDRLTDVDAQIRAFAQCVAVITLAKPKDAES